jgi:hypothetical protein
MCSVLEFSIRCSSPSRFDLRNEIGAQNLGRRATEVARSAAIGAKQKLNL